MTRYPRLQAMVAVLICTLVVSFLLLYDFGKSGSQIIQSLTSYGHIPLFGLIALGILRLLGRGTSQIREKGTYIKAGAITFLLGTTTEILQTFTATRTFKLTDILSDTIGGAVFLGFLYSYRSGMNRKTGLLLRSSALLALLIMAHPIIIATIDTVQMERSAPLLGSFETRLEMTRWNSTTSTLTRSRLHATHGQYALEAHLSPNVYPGVSMVHLFKDWRGYTALSFDVFLTGSSPLRITVRINDEEHNQAYHDRFNESLILQPNHNHLSINLEDVKTSPQGRLMDMSRIQTVCIFVHNLKSPRTLYFDNFRLESQSRNEP